MIESGKRAAAARFSAASASYDQYADVQRAAAERVVALVRGIDTSGPVLEVGCGTGILTGMLAAAMPDRALVAQDISSGMVEMARKRFGDAVGIEWNVKQIEDFEAKGQFGLIASSSTLHWMAPLQKAFKTLASLLVQDGFLVFSIMVEGTLRELHESRRKVAPMKMPTAAVPSRDEIPELLAGAGFALLKQDGESLRVSCSSASELLRILHAQGVTGGILSRTEMPLNRTELQNLVSYYDSHYQQGTAGVYASYNIEYVLARKE